MKKIFLFIFLVAISFCSKAQDSTYAQRLGFPKDARVIILHMDDAGMSLSSDRGVEKVFEKGVANSTSVMMPCPWVPQMVRYIKAHPGIDAGLHLTLTSEWKDYRWGPLAGAAVVPGLVDSTGSMWRGVADVVKHASAEEVDKEMRAQLQRAEKMNFHPTHLDSHMGTLFATDAFLQKYIQLGIEKQIPVMFPGGHDTYISDEMKIPDNVLHSYQNLGKKIWDGGLPVLDDLLNSSYDWNPPADIVKNEKALAKWRVDLYEKAMLKLKPGVTMVIMHCTDPSSVFSEISDSGDKRRADMLAMLDAGFKKFLKDNGFVLTTWRELMERRQKIK
ncbi:ChbG/HpnK family deacetylase [Hanamia caeni]|uniref:ChbG/HpnK family deacetylase n=1 Tax=Hanamia caeni TaxID=2294116 RepID=A0A3M9NGN1_9BACT|nr:polysaccharide deacetylase family protein [Hanamia caeni]RNI36891.1 ChbG/HpnK family deacetylase [Hanamia caeni]